MLERFDRDSKNDLTLTLTMDDPKLYTKQFALGEEHFRWIPNQMLDDFTCIPSQLEEYLKEMGDPAGYDPNAPSQRRYPTVAGAAGPDFILRGAK